MNKKKTIAALTVLVMVVSSLVMLAPPVKAAAPAISLATIQPGHTWDTDESSMTDMGSMGNLTFYTPGTDQSGVGKYDVQYYSYQEDVPTSGYSDGTYQNAWNVEDQMSAGSTSAECIVIHETIPGVQGWPADGGTYIGSTNMTMTTASTDYLPSIHLEEIPSPTVNAVGSDYVNITWTGLLEQISDEYYSDISEDWGPLPTNNIVNYSVYRSTDNATWTFVGNSSAQVRGGAVYFEDTGLSSGTYYYRIGVNFRYPANTGGNIAYQHEGLYIGLTAAGYTPEDSTQFPGIYMSQGKGNATGGITVGSASTATATGPTNTAPSNVADITITYTNDSGATSVDLYYTTDGGTTWTLIGGDSTIDGTYDWTIPADGTYGWIAVADGESAPVSGDAPEASSYTYDGTAPTVSSTSPADSATDVAVNTQVDVTYSENMDTSVTPTLTQTGGTDNGGWTFLGWSGNTASWSHNDWNLADTVTLQVSGAQDVAGNVQTAYTWSFTTASDSQPPVVTITGITDPIEGGADQTVTATVDDSTTGGSNIVSATYTVIAPSGMVAVDNASMSASDGAFDSPTETVTATFSTVGWATGTYTVFVYGSDGNIGSASTTYVEQDTSAPTFTYDLPSDGATVAADQPINVYAYIDDANHTSDIDNTTVILHWTNDSWTNTYTITMTYADSGVSNTVKYVGGRWYGAIPAQADGTSISYYIDAADVVGNAATGPTYTITASSASLSDPYPVYGYVWIYNGNGGVYNPLLCDGTAYGLANVVVSWVNSSSGLTDSITVTTDNAGRYQVDLHNYTDGGTITVNASDGGLAARYNINTTTISVADGGSMVNVTFGIPYNLNITNPADGSSVITGNAFNVDYTVYDVNGVVAPGYYGTVHLVTGDPLGTMPADYTFGGIGVDDGTATVSATLVTGGIQYLNATDTLMDMSPPAEFTDAGEWWDNITLNVLSTGFTWDLSQPGWHVVSVPQIPIATNDSASEIVDLIYSTAQGDGITLADITIANRTGANPSTYDTWIRGSGGVDFAIEVGMAYWVYVDQGFPTSVSIQANNYTAATFTKTVFAGWNMIGLAHNDSVGVLSNGGLVQFADSDGAGVNIGMGPTDGYITYTGGTPWYISYWNVGTQKYDTYVYKFNFNQPTDSQNHAINIFAGATGFWLYVRGGGSISYSVEA